MVARPEAGRSGRDYDAQPGAAGRAGGGIGVPTAPTISNELSYRALTRHLLPECGFEFVEQDCLYLELRLRNLFNRDRVTDFLQRQGNRAEYVPTMRLMFPLGRYAPWVAMGLIVVARKPRGARS